MIGRLSGKILSKQPPEVVIDVNGVGYEVEAPLTAFYDMPNAGQSIHLFIHTHVREDALQLFGFASAADRQLFRSLIKVNGVGARLALTILSGIETQQFITAVQQQDITSLVKLPGVGKKTAERLVIEMRDKLTQFDAQLPAVGSVAAADGIEEAVNALIALGYKPNEASKMVRKLGDKDGPLTELSTEEIIKLALRHSISA